MSWITETAALYDEIKEKVNDSDEWEPILPLYHSTSNAQIQVTIFSDGTFSHAEVVDADDAKTIIPVTEDSGSRGNGILPNPLCDKLIYIAGDYSTYVAKAKSDADEYFVTYIKALKAWAESEYSDICITAIYDYLSKRMLINDLIYKNPAHALPQKPLQTTIGALHPRHSRNVPDAESALTRCALNRLISHLA